MPATTGADTAIVSLLGDHNNNANMSDQKDSMLNWMLACLRQRYEECFPTGSSFYLGSKHFWQRTLFLLLPSFTTNLQTGIVMPDGHTGKLPTMGWNSWKAGEGHVSTEKVINAAEALISTGLREAGYSYVNLDDGWQDKNRTATHHLQADPIRFPDGIKGLATVVHGMNFSLGIYSDAAYTTCGHNPGSLERENIDAADFADWGVDYLKYDNCFIPKNWIDEYTFCAPDRVKTGHNGTCSEKLTRKIKFAPRGYDWSTSNSAKRYNRMRDALSKQSRQILLSMSIWGTADVYSWGNHTGISWRTTHDMLAYWARFARNLNINSFHTHSTNFWGRNDADLLQVGNGDLTDAECRSHFALWAALKSPLIITTNITNLSSTNLELLKNKYLIAFNQDDVHGESAQPYKWGRNKDWTFNETHPAEYWAGPSKNGTLVLMLNTGDEAEDKEAVWAEIPGLCPDESSSCLGMSYRAIDIWSGNDLGCLRDSYQAKVESHDTAGILVQAAC